ncbi:MAG TPA: hypothetical protein VKB57_20305 [Acidimicrobiales bacterium]|nr:hypothetical protein [Acidimicrobiales bacterium]
MTTTLADDGDRPSYLWVSAARAGEMLGLQVTQVYMLIDRGHVPGYRIAGEIRLLIEDVERLRARWDERRRD